MEQIPKIKAMRKSILVLFIAIAGLGLFGCNSVDKKSSMYVFHEKDGVFYDCPYNGKSASGSPKVQGNAMIIEPISCKVDLDFYRTDNFTVRSTSRANMGAYRNDTVVIVWQNKDVIPFVTLYDKLSRDVVYKQSILCGGECYVKPLKLNIKP